MERLGLVGFPFDDEFMYETRYTFRGWLQGEIATTLFFGLEMYGYELGMGGVCLTCDGKDERAMIL